MLRRLDLKDPWRSLESGFWPDDRPSGCRTVVYGHNGSGKSTLSELLLSLAEGDSATGVIWEDRARHRTTVSAGGAAPSAYMAVFTRKWVEANISAFLDGKSTSAIVTLGKDAIDAKEEEERLIGEIAKLRDDAKEAAKQHKAAADKVDKLARDTQDRIISELKVFDYAHFTKNRYSVPKVQDDLRNYNGHFPNSDAYAEALKHLGEGTPSAVSNVPTVPSAITGKLAGLVDLLVETPARVAIQALAGNPQAQTWVEQGVALHEGLDQCLFCAGKIGGARRDQLASHFDESWLQIRGRAKALQTAVESEKVALVTWHHHLPAAVSLSSELQAVYEDAVERAKIEVDERVAILQAVENALEAKAADPSAKPEAPEWSVLRSPLSTTVLAQAVTEHNDQARRHAELTADRKQTVLDHLVGSQSQAFRQLEEHAKELATKRDSAYRAAGLAERRLAEVRQAQFTTKDMADTLTRDLARVYGKDHLSVASRQTASHMLVAAETSRVPISVTANGPRCRCSTSCGSWRTSSLPMPVPRNASW